ncbi:MAG TPA: zf-HC2 domain-containing protein [Pyrinomonadaceae bacterium]|nr:zf-HC2 domain-containing protein [Pyrinomonadaceae bacterium]
MKCEQRPNLIDDLIEGELDEQSAEKVNLHVFACAECAFRFKAAKREREIYARYLFDAEPPVDLRAKFQAKLESENKIISQTAETSAAVEFGWKTNVFGFRSLNPTFAGAVLVVIFGIGFGLSKFMGGEKAMDNNSVAENNPVDIKSTAANLNRNKKDESADLLTKTENRKKNLFPAVIKSKDENNFADGNSRAGKKVKFVAVKTAVNTKQTISGEKKKDLTGDERKDSITVAELTEDETRDLRFRTLEKETVRQIEKIELLLRSFRNARSAGESGNFDVAYEKLQARKLLEKNVQLRQGAESYGTFYTEEILGRVEPYLLDISNLENNPPPEKVREIKERVKNQNIIASLQSY